jgi:hypothetical protein
MKSTIFAYSVFVSIVFYSINIFAQCSDAGICQLGGHHPEEDSKSLFDISASYKYGYSGKDDDVQFHSFQLNGIYNLSSKTSLLFLLPYNIQSGPAGDVSGIGDMILSINQKLIADGSSSLDASVGVKLATGDDNKDNLPQVYQSGLGSNDILFALNYNYDRLSFGAGYQVAGKRNENIYRLERGDDLLLRGAYQFSFDVISITPQVLFIQRLAKSSIIDFNSATESYVEVENSDQAQLNLLTLIEYDLEVYKLFVDFAIPFIEREVNVDGLTRAFSVSAGVKFSID